MDKNHKTLMGKTKTEIIQEMGDEFNYYPGNIWTYTLKRHWLRKDKILIILFKDEVVVGVQIHKV